MIVIESILGNLDDAEWSQRLSAIDVDLLEVDQWEAQKSRFRKTTRKGAEVAISLDRGTNIRDGDVLFWDLTAGVAIIAKIDLRDVMIVHLDDLGRFTPEIAMRTCVELGHAMGNQHWPALVKDNVVYVPLTVDRKVMASVMNTHRFEGIRYEFVPGREVILYLAPHESRRLFGGAEGPVHSHARDRYAVVDAATGRAHTSPPVRHHAHPDADNCSKKLLVKSVPTHDHGEDGAEIQNSVACLARTLQFGDSMFPIGGFSFSCGLESAIHKGVVGDAATLHAFTRTAVEQAARGDGVALIHAHRAAEVSDINALVLIDQRIYARKLSSEMRTMSVRMGKKFTEMGVQMIGGSLLCKWRDCIETSATPGSYPVALALNFAAQGLPAIAAFVAHQHGVAATILGAALRLMKISHVETQKILYELNGRVEVSYETAAAIRLSNMAGYAPLAEVLTAVHAKAHVRLFMS